MSRLLRPNIFFSLFLSKPGHSGLRGLHSQPGHTFGFPENVVNWTCSVYIYVCMYVCMYLCMYVMRLTPIRYNIQQYKYIRFPCKLSVSLNVWTWGYGLPYIILSHLSHLWLQLYIVLDTVLTPVSVRSTQKICSSLPAQDNIALCSSLF